MEENTENVSRKDSSKDVWWKEKSGTVWGVVGFGSLAALLGYIQTTAQGGVITTIVTAVAGLVATVFSMFTSNSVNSVLNKLADAEPADGVSETNEKKKELAKDVQSRLRTAGVALFVFLFCFIGGEAGGSAMNNWITFSGPRRITGIHENGEGNELNNLSTQERLMLLDLKARMTERGYREKTIDWIMKSFNDEAVAKKALDRPTMIEDLKKLPCMTEDNYKKLTNPKERDEVLSLMLVQTYDEFNKRWKFGALVSTDLKTTFPAKSQ